MAECLVGGHLDNVDRPPDESYAKLRAMRARVVGTLWTNGTRHRRPVYDRLERDLGNPEYVVRVGPSGKTAPGQWLVDASDAVMELPPDAVARGRVRLRVLNEVNLPDEGAWSPEEYAAFLAAVFALSGPLRCPLVASPLSLGLGGWADWYARFLAACPRPLPFARQAVNCYSHLATPENLAVFAAAGVPVDITEVNTLALRGAERAAWLDRTMRALAGAGAGVRSQQVFIVGGESHGAWDEGYILSGTEAAWLGDRLGGTIAVEETTEVRPVHKRALALIDAAWSAAEQVEAAAAALDPVDADETWLVDGLNADAISIKAKAHLAKRLIEATNA